MFTSIAERIPIKQLIATQIEDSILSKKYQPGSKLPSENELCAQFKVSRTSVREALQILSAQGLITVEKGKGIFVNKISSESVINPLQKFLRLKLDRNYAVDLVHTRQLIEPAIAREASLNRDEIDLDLMKKNVQEMAECESTSEIIEKYDMEFHQLLARATKNIVIPILISPIHHMMPELKLKIFDKVEDAREVAVIWHRKILKAVKERNGDRAFKAMSAHLKIAEEHAGKLFTKTNLKR